MKFEYLGAPQKSPEWFQARLGKVTASRLCDWLAVSKAKTGAGKPLKARLDYEKELMFERQFGVSFSTYVTDAMQEGIDFEDFARKQYENTTGTSVREVGCWYNDVFVASPDGLVTVEKAPDKERHNLYMGKPYGLVEIKIVKDNTFTEVLTSGVPDKHLKQIQGQLFATGALWCDYVCLNFNTKKFAVIRVEPDKEFFDYLEEALKETLVTQPFSVSNLHDIQGEIPAGVEMGAHIDRSNSNLTGGW
jgi:predicted phage-related endonuclease